MLSEQDTTGRAGGAGSGRRLRHGRCAPPYDRNKFLAANFSFLVSDGASLALASADADVPLDWEDVLQARDSAWHALRRLCWMCITVLVTRLEILGSLFLTGVPCAKAVFHRGGAMLGAGEHADGGAGVDVPYCSGAGRRSANHAVW